MQFIAAAEASFDGIFFLLLRIAAGSTSVIEEYREVLPRGNGGFGLLSDRLFAALNRTSIEDKLTILAGCGPGSFTGIRSLLAMVRGVDTGLKARQTSNVEIIGVSGVEVIWHYLAERYPEKTWLLLRSSGDVGFLVTQNTNSDRPNLTRIRLTHLAGEILFISEATGKGVRPDADTKIIVLDDWDFGKNSRLTFAVENLKSTDIWFEAMVALTKNPDDTRNIQHKLEPIYLRESTAQERLQAVSMHSPKGS